MQDTDGVQQMTTVEGGKTEPQETMFKPAKRTRRAAHLHLQSREQLSIFSREWHLKRQESIDLVAK